MTCREVSKNLLAWVEGELDEVTWLAITQHVESCESCRDEAESLRKVIEAIRIIAKSDGIPPIPQRLEKHLNLHRSRLPSFVPVFMTACLAFLIGWHARSIAQSFSLPKRNVSEIYRPSSANSAHRNNHKSLDLPLSKVSLQVTFSLLTIAPKEEVGFGRNHHQSGKLPLMLKGATSSACDVESFRHRHSLAMNFTKNETACQSASDSLTDWSSNGFVWVLVPVNGHEHTEPSTYRIFVQVTDPLTQTIRTVKVDTTKPEHILANWSETSDTKPETAEPH